MATNMLTKTNGTVESTRNGKTYVPRVDIFESDHELLLYADVPGVAPGSIDLRYERGELTLHGKVNPRPRTGQMILGEYDSGDFYRVFQVHEAIDASKIEAEHKNGVLTVHLPKQESVKPKQIAVKGK